MKWFWIILAILYMLSPLDLIPGWAPVSRIDDLVVLILLVRYLRRLKSQAPAGERAGNGRNATGEQNRSARDQETSADPYRILGITPGASQEEVRRAYRKLANQYHPDKVTHLGKEFQELAEKRFKEIQQAYQRLKRGP